MQVVQKTQSLKRISFLAHSLGGLFARYAIAVLYTPNTSSISQSDDLKNSKKENSQSSCSSRRGMIAGLEPINFITLATPHLGVRGKKQVCSNGYSLYCWYYYITVNQNLCQSWCVGASSDQSYPHTSCSAMDGSDYFVAL